MSCFYYPVRYGHILSGQSLPWTQLHKSIANQGLVITGWPELTPFPVPEDKTFIESNTTKKNRSGPSRDIKVTKGTTRNTGIRMISIEATRALAHVCKEGPHALRVVKIKDGAAALTTSRVPWIYGETPLNHALDRRICFVNKTCSRANMRPPLPPGSSSVQSKPTTPPSAPSPSSNSSSPSSIKSTHPLNPSSSSAVSLPHPIPATAHKPAARSSSDGKSSSESKPAPRMPSSKAKRSNGDTPEKEVDAKRVRRGYGLHVDSPVPRIPSIPAAPPLQQMRSSVGPPPLSNDGLGVPQVPEGLDYTTLPSSANVDPRSRRRRSDMMQVDTDYFAPPDHVPSSNSTHQNSLASNSFGMTTNRPTTFDGSYFNNQPPPHQSSQPAIMGSSESTFSGAGPMQSMPSSDWGSDRHQWSDNGVQIQTQNVWSMPHATSGNATQYGSQSMSTDVQYESSHDLRLPSPANSEWSSGATDRAQGAGNARPPSSSGQPPLPPGVTHEVMMQWLADTYARGARPSGS